MEDVTFVIVTVSDSCFAGTAQDKSGPALKELIEQTYWNCSIVMELVPDDQSKIEAILLKHCETNVDKVKVIFTTGGTGFSPRDVTPEATRTVIKRECPQLTLAMSLESFQKTPFAALSRAVCGIRDQTLIINFPGSVKAVKECFQPVKNVLQHIIHLMCNKIELVTKEHHDIQAEHSYVSVHKPGKSTEKHHHTCPHKTGKGTDTDRNSTYSMIPVQEALKLILDNVKTQREFLLGFQSPIDIPPFRASIKDGYAVKSSSLSGIKKVLGVISAGDSIIRSDFEEDECYKINTGAALPHFADCIIQVEDTKLIKSSENGDEKLVQILMEPKANLDVRPIGTDLEKGENIFPNLDLSDICIKSIFASIGKDYELPKPKVGIISTGNELSKPEAPEVEGKIYDSNTTMLRELLKYFGFECFCDSVISDSQEEVMASIDDMFNKCDFIVCSGGVSMGDKDFIKPVLMQLGFKIHFGRVNMKPGKPMTFGSKGTKYFFGLPGNPVSAFVCFHLFVLPAIRWWVGWDRRKCELSELLVTLENEKLQLDPRPEFVRATITSRNGRLYATVTGNQMSSRLQSIVGADVLLQLPERTEMKPFAVKGDIFTASILRYDFISNYE
ncbi:molybdenum cofactor synthesis protein cinnamon [Condylostylus longicornis]|uniref:molybdenum cofactor synthesis protein cinnamon n=1 Tax=Condylostylus longicornis TaxID=2530218 RepID=UPI00244E04AB|nr:molybdenum cofactor synthesis protein cinnamon [Condylostylus longicornis]